MPSEADEAVHLGWPDSFVTTDEDRRALLVLMGLRGITPRKQIEVAARARSATATLTEIREGRAGSEHDRELAASADPVEIAATAAACGARLIAWGSAEYPPQLRQAHDPPAGLFVLGGGIPDPTRAVAIVGARRCTELGRELAHEMGRALGFAGVTVVSGAARGIDAAGHEGALEAGGRTVAVLGCGIDVAYPRASRELLERIRSKGTVVSEYAPGTPPVQRNFPARNRIIAAVCSATVVVEGAERSGSLITAEHAMDLGRDVYAIPGAVTNPLAAAPLQLIRDGAAMIRGPEDLLHDLGLELSVERIVEQVELSGRERDVLARLAGPTLPERVAGALDATVPEAVAVLMRLELRGLVRCVGGRYESTLQGSAASSAS